VEKADGRAKIEVTLEDTTLGWEEKRMVAKSHYICCQPDRNSAALSQFAVDQGCTAKPVEVPLSILNRSYYGWDLPVREGSATSSRFIRLNALT
jgi:hypothetical protein